MASGRTLGSRLTLEEVTRFLKAKLLNGSQCPRCGTDDWRYADESETNELLGPAILDGQGVQTGIYATINLSCGNCGFVSAHAKNVVVQWLNEHE